jgi:hypothetical protein
MIYLVTGFMRSGTSMMCECLEAGGMSVVKSEARDRFGAAHGDEHYAVNPNGLYEPNPRDMQSPGWPRQHDGKALKVVFPWLNALAVHQYKAVAMLRDAEEIRQSFEGAFGKSIPLERIRQASKEGLEKLNNRRDVQLICLCYSEVVSDPLGAFGLLGSQGWPIEPAKAAAVVKPELYRFRLETLTVGI